MISQTSGGGGGGQPHPLHGPCQITQLQCTAGNMIYVYTYKPLFVRHNVTLQISVLRVVSRANIRTTCRVENRKLVRAFSALN